MAMLVVSLFIFLAFLNGPVVVAFPEPVPQEDGGGGGGGEDNDAGGTSKCTAEEYDAFLNNTVDPCYFEAHDKALDVVGGEEALRTRRGYWNFLCNRTEGRLECLSELGNGCLDEEEKKDFRANRILFTEFLRAFDDQVDLGESYILNCQLLRDSEEEVLKARRAYPDRCTFFQFERGFRTSDECYDKVRTRFDKFFKKLDMGEGPLTQEEREERFEVSCAYYKGHTGDCINPFLACVDDEYARELKANDRERVDRLAVFFGISLEVLEEDCAGFRPSSSTLK